jgi:hypothetical protein
VTEANNEKAEPATEHLEVDTMVKRAESGLQRMEKRFEERCLDIARKIELDRRKVMDADLGRYKSELQELMHEHESHLQTLLARVAPSEKPKKTEPDKKNSSGSENEEPKSEKAKKKKPNKKNSSGSENEEEPSASGYNLRRRVAKPAACVFFDNDMLDDLQLGPRATKDDDDLGGWGSDVSDATTNNKVQEEAPTEKDEGLHETVHKLILMMQELTAPTHEALDAMWITLSNLKLDGPTRTDIEDIGDRQAALVRTLIVLHDRVSAEAIRLQVSPNTLYCTIEDAI